MLSKSQYTKFLQCPKLFWLSRNRRELLSDADAQLKQRFERGHQVGELACDLFPGGEKILLNLKEVNAAVDRTSQLIDQGVTTLYEAAFLSQELFAAVDILHFHKDQWHIYEVKSSTSVKETYLDDAAVQAFLLKKCGLSIGSVNIIYINNQYFREGELDIKQLFNMSDVTQEVELRQPVIAEQIAEMGSLLHQTEPSQPIGLQCFSPYECSAKEYCWKTIYKVPDYSVFNLTRASMKNKLELFYRGIVSIPAVPMSKRTPAQILQVKGDLFMDRNKIKKFCSEIREPIAHLDFESYQQIVPEFDGINPFCQIPFQYSIHIESGDSLTHREFLAEVGVDPRRSVAEGLLKDLPTSGSILAYNSSFETHIIKKLAERFDDLRDALLALLPRMIDLMKPFQQKWYYHPAMQGSYSIKKVLPALVPDFVDAYKALPGVNNGADASTRWSELSQWDDTEKIEQERKGFLAYCGLDTLAMVKVLESLKRV